MIDTTIDQACNQNADSELSASLLRRSGPAGDRVAVLAGVASTRPVHPKNLPVSQPVRALVQLDPFAPAFYCGRGRGVFFHVAEACKGLTKTRNRRARAGLGKTPRSRVGAMVASGRRPCPTCIGEVVA